MSDGGRRHAQVPVTCASIAVLAVAAGVVAVVVDEPVFALVAAVLGVVAAGIGALVDARRWRAESSMWEARAQARSLRREVDRARLAEVGMDAVGTRDGREVVAALARLRADPGLDIVACRYQLLDRTGG